MATRSRATGLLLLIRSQATETGNAASPVVPKRRGGVWGIRLYPPPEHAMASEDILRYIDSLARDKEIDKNELFESIEQAVAAALSKKYGIEDLSYQIRRDRPPKPEIQFQILISDHDPRNRFSNRRF